jgi:hypothetical protein
MMFLRSIGIAASLLVAPAALAQDVAPLPTQAASFSDEQLRNFAKAVIDLRALSEIYSPRLRAASIDNAKEVRAEAKDKAAAAMRKHMLTSRAAKDGTLSSPARYCTCGAVSESRHEEISADQATRRRLARAHVGDRADPPQRLPPARTARART